MTAPTDVVLTKGSRVVTIAMTKLKTTYNKMLIKITPPVTGNNSGVDTPKANTKVVDINREAEIRYDVDGYIHTGFPATGDSQTDVLLKMADLNAMFFARGGITMQFFGESKTVFIDKFDFDYSADDGAGSATPTIDNLSVKFTAVEGVDIIG